MEKTKYLIDDLAVNKILNLEEADLFTSFAGLLQYAIIHSPNEQTGEYKILLVIVSDGSFIQRMFDYAKALLTNDIIFLKKNDRIFTKDLHILFSKAVDGVGLGYNPNFVLLDLSTKKCEECALNILPKIHILPNTKCITIKKLR